jgi:hypothetical protein
VCTATARTRTSKARSGARTRRSKLRCVCRGEGSCTPCGLRLSCSDSSCAGQRYFRGAVNNKIAGNMVVIQQNSGHGRHPFAQNHFVIIEHALCEHRHLPLACSVKQRVEYAAACRGDGS